MSKKIIEIFDCLPEDDGLSEGTINAHKYTSALFSLFVH